MRRFDAITVVVAGRDAGVRAACARLLRRAKGVHVLGEARSGEDTIAAAQLKPRIVLLSLDPPLRSSIGLLPLLRRRTPRTRVILLTDRAKEGMLLDALALGARGYLEKKALPTFLPKAVRRVDAGEAWVPRNMIGKLVERLLRLTARPA